MKKSLPKNGATDLKFLKTQMAKSGYHAQGINYG